MIYVTFQYAFILSLFSYKALHGLTPSYLTDTHVAVESNPALRRNRSADRGDLVVPRVKNTSYGHRSFAIAAPRLWTLYRVSYAAAHQ